MNKKPLCRFFNLNLHHDGGFTLVELIVVIAILANLAGVAVPVYSGYIEKANKAGDEQLLAAVNLAFSTACIEQNVDITTIPDQGVSLTLENACVTGVDFKDATIDDDAFNEAFLKYYANTNAAMKVYTHTRNFVYSGVLHAFGILDVEMETFTYKLANGTTVTLNYAKEDLDNFSASDFAQYSKDGTLLTNVDNVVDWAVDALGKDSNQLLTAIEEDADFLAFAESMFGDSYDEADFSQKMNALVLFTAQKTGDINGQAVLDKMLAHDYSSAFVKDPNAETGTEIANLAMQYALGLAYYREQNHDKTNPTVTEIQNAMQYKGYTYDEEGERVKNQKSDFQIWLETNGADNMAGYLGAMSVVSDNLSNIPAADLLANGYNNDDLQGMLDKLLK